MALKKRGFGKGRWNGVGGKVDPDETIPQAAIRECQEEICVTPTTYEQVAEFVFDAYLKGVRTDMHVSVFECTTWEGEPRETEEMKPKWFSVTDIPYDQMWQDDQHWLPLVLEGKKVKGTFAFDQQDQMLSKELHTITSFSG